MVWFTTLLLGYLAGTFPTGVIIGRLKGVDLYSTGSGSVGATNVARSIGKGLGAVTLIVDIFKGILACAFADHFVGDRQLTEWVGVAAISGHCFSIPTMLRGGKGVATALGVFLYLAPGEAGIGLLCFILVMLMTQIVSLSSMIAALVIGAISMKIPIIIIALLVIYRHSPNIKRLLAGEEKKFTFKKSSE